jgi:hypothetical protein
MSQRHNDKVLDEMVVGPLTDAMLSRVNLYDRHYRRTALYFQREILRQAGGSRKTRNPRNRKTKTKTKTKRT